MSTSYVLIALLSLLILSSQIDSTMAKRKFPSSAPSTMISKDYGTLKPDLSNKKHHVLSDKDIKNCKPKGVRHTSAPSRFVNMHPFSSLGCSTGRNEQKP
ncbi:hypothetical protein LIER_26095 [Lithospermum erythrorhizon]|uniref:Uncharacterized protein n=1 Tax=Lithospermum erythrorhizon TaxID=34254 RepID=A0AAV3RAJ7_LITER